MWYTGGVNKVGTSQEDAMKPILDEDALYMGDNGRIFCGRVTCAGNSAAYAGRTISGHRVRRLSLLDAQAWRDEMISVGCSHLAEMRCETCGKSLTGPQEERG